MAIFSGGLNLFLREVVMLNSVHLDGFEQF
jgi:hypothetical protein